MPSAIDILRAKVSVPSELRTAQWSALPTWIRERSFFMAAVDRAETLDSFRTVTGKLLDGTMSLAEGREALRSALSDQNYAPEPGAEGTIKDLGTFARQNVALETNFLAVNGFARWTRQQSALGGYPAQRLVRLRVAQAPRDWDARWQDALGRSGGLPGATGASEKVALVNHPIWVALSAFGTPYPPFDFNSGMGIEPVPLAEANALGILPEADADPEHAAMLQPQDRGLNATLQATPAIRSQSLRNALAESVQGLAEWDGDTLVFTDPNGTRPYTAARLANVWDHDLPDGIPALQRDAMSDWIGDPASYAGKNGTDRWADLVRAFERIAPTAGNAPLYQGIAFNNREAFDQFVSSTQKGGALDFRDLPAMSFSSTKNDAAKYAEAGRFQAHITVQPGHARARDISPIRQAMSESKAQSEVIFVNGTPLVVVGHRVASNGTSVELTVREVVR